MVRGVGGGAIVPGRGLSGVDRFALDLDRWRGEDGGAGAIGAGDRAGEGGGRGEGASTNRMLECATEWQRVALHLKVKWRAGTLQTDQL